MVDACSQTLQLYFVPNIFVKEKISYKWNTKYVNNKKKIVTVTIYRQGNALDMNFLIFTENMVRGYWQAKKNR